MKETYGLPYLQAMNEREPLKHFNTTPTKDTTAEIRAKCLELASKLRCSEEGQMMTLKELCGKAEELFNFINKK